MPRASASKNFFTFIGGMNTETSPLISPENTARLLQNVDLDTTGKISRRLGLDFESGFSLSTDTFTETETKDNYTSIDEWISANGDVDQNFYVIRVGLKLFFFDMIATAPSNNLIGSLTLTGNTDALATMAKEDIQFNSGNGVLFVTGRTIKPSFITFTSPSTFVQTIISMEIRDFEGVDDGLAIENRPATLSVDHNYNLQNQGWITTNINLVFTGLAVYPSNADVQVAGKNSDDTFTAALLNKQFFGNTLAAKGHFIIDAFDDNRGAVSGLGLTDSTTVKRPLSSTFFAGRVWYAGPNGKVLFSQILDTNAKVGRCYQAQDPTAEDFNELLATDGGVIDIPEMGDALRVISTENSILVFSSTGVWQINGGTENFSAVNFQVHQITNVGLTSPRSVIKAEDIVFYWSDGGIYSLISDPASGLLKSQNITEGRIQEDYSHIKQSAKNSAVGTYDRESKRIAWVFDRNRASSAQVNEQDYDTALLFHTTLGAFYLYSLSNITVGGITSYISGVLKSNARVKSVGPSIVTVSGIAVTVSAVNVTVQENFSGADILALKTLMFSPQSGVFKFTLGEFTSRSFHDWFSQDSTGVDYPSIIETGYEMLGDAMRDKQVQYLFALFARGRAAIDTNTLFSGD